MLRRTLLKSPLAAPLLAIGESKSFEKEALARMAVGLIPGAIVGAIRNGKTHWIKGLGVLGANSPAPVDANSVFQAANLTKQVIAYAAFALQASGKLDFDQTLCSYVDDLKDPLARKVTLRHVLSHSSGFPNWRFEEGKSLVPSFDPGSRFQYSGEGFFLSAAGARSSYRNGH
ncbi:MAG: beta-lactamase family protein [Acidobacteria bacterium]|nr:beta-lactamase family protein [Acidobacteriota bacterium]